MSNSTPWFPWLLLLGCGSLVGCAQFRSNPSLADAPLPNPIEIPVTEHEFVWNSLVDTVDDYFPIEREERVRVIGNVMTSGSIVTKPVTGATKFEFFRRDSTPGFERWHGTLQSIRRSAEVRVLPANSGYGVSVVVRKELEDVSRPEMSLVGSVIQRHDGSLVRPSRSRVGGAVNLGWIPIGRDIALEQKILADIYARFNTLTPPPAVQTLHHDYPTQ